MRAGLLSTPDLPDRRFLAGMLLVTLVALGLRVFLLPSQPVSYDDYSMGVTAINYMESGQLGPIMWNHPELGNILVYGCMKLFGTGVLGLKGPSVAIGTLSVLLLGLVARRIAGDGRVALLAALFWALDPLAIDLSRQAVHEIYMSFFPLAGIWCICRYRATERSRWLFGAGILFGLGLAAKWSMLFPLAVSLAFVAHAIWRRDKGLSTRIAAMAGASAQLLLLPLLIYLLTFTPWFGRGYSMPEWLALQRSMYQETKLHSGLGQVEQRDHRALAWFVRPVSWTDTMINRVDEGDPAPMEDAMVDKRVTLLVALSNPFVWLLVLPAVFFTARRGIRERNEGLLFAVTLFLAAYLPLALTHSRPIFVNAALSVLPFALVPVAYLLVSTLCTTPARKRIFALYLALVVLASIPLYLLAIGKVAEVPFLRDYFLQI